MASQTREPKRRPPLNQDVAPNLKAGVFEKGLHSSVDVSAISVNLIEAGACQQAA